MLQIPVGAGMCIDIFPRKSIPHQTTPGVIYFKSRELDMQHILKATAKTPYDSSKITLLHELLRLCFRCL